MDMQCVLCTVCFCFSICNIVFMHNVILLYLCCNGVLLLAIEF